MEIALLVTHVKHALLLVLLLSLPVLVVTSVVGVVVAFLQAVTQVQDQTISFGIKLAVAIVAVALTAAWLGAELVNFADRMFASIPDVR